MKTLQKMKILGVMSYRITMRNYIQPKDVQRVVVWKAHHTIRHVQQVERQAQRECQRE